MLTTAYAGLDAVDFSEPKKVAGYALSVLLSGVLMARGFIDKTTSEVIPKSDQP